MRIRVKAVALFGLGALVIGCGGGGDVTTTQAPGSTTTGEVTTSTVATTSATTANAGGGGTAAGVCELVTADELAQIFNVGSVSMSVLQGPPDSCIVESDAGDPLSAWSLTIDQAQVVFDAFTSDPSSVEVVPGIGDSAAIVENTGLLVLKGGRLIVISISGGADLSDDEAVEASKRIGEIAAGRL
jgi:hypothetical protein